MRKRFRLPDYVRELLVRGCAVLGLVTVTGLLSNILILVLGYIIALPHLMDYLTGYFMRLNNTGLWILYSTLSLIFCAILNGVFLTHIGASAAQYRRSNPGHVRNPAADTLITLSIGCGIHALLTWIVAKMGLSYLFFAGPVQYLARLIGDGRRSLFADVSYYFPAWVITASVLIYAAVIFAACWIGYAIGRRKKNRLLDDAEKEARKGTPPEKTWSAADAAQTPYAYRHDQRR